ncbi:MAG: 4Fe-4S cluster-binding domain-containing protein, partial [Treponema sp.]|nr:4Fe-4S cluster-binding domain-containing protein [Treponema sp.]
MTNCSIRLAGITQESFVDGPGLRYVIFAQGCHHRCEGCHNQKSWDINAGTEFSVKDVIKSIKTQKKAIQGITFSGGEPFHQAGNLSRIA